MVSSLGSGRMAVMARLLAAGSSSETSGDEVRRQKLAVQCIQRELNEADEPNLLDGEDMHVFGLKPMTDPLDLVRCNACRKPVKASQYAAHAVLCRSLITGEPMIKELDSDTGRMKLTKERKRLSTAHINHTMPVVEQERSITIDAECLTSSRSQLDGQPGVSSLPLDRRNSAYGGVTSLVNGKASPNNTDRSACLLPPPTKCSKLVSSQHLLQLNNPGVASSLAKIRSVQDTYTCRDFQMQCTSRSNIYHDFPAPLATKAYYSQKSNRLRSSVGHMYSASSSNGFKNDALSPQSPNESLS